MTRRRWRPKREVIKRMTPEVQDSIIKSVRAGAYLETAAAYAGIDKYLLLRWLKIGRARPKGVYGRFVEAIERAWAESEIRDVHAIGKATEHSWQAAAWRLERRFPKRWGRQERVEVSGPDGGPIAVDVQTLDLAKLSTAELQALETILVRALPAGEEETDVEEVPPNAPDDPGESD